MALQHKTTVDIFSALWNYEIFPNFIATVYFCIMALSVIKIKLSYINDNNNLLLFFPHAAFLIEKSVVAQLVMKFRTF